MLTHTFVLTLGLGKGKRSSRNREKKDLLAFAESTQGAEVIISRARAGCRFLKNKSGGTGEVQISGDLLGNPAEGNRPSRWAGECVRMTKGKSTRRSLVSGSKRTEKVRIEGGKESVIRGRGGGHSGTATKLTSSCK